jgi:hypothetical protein
MLPETRRNKCLEKLLQGSVTTSFLWSGLVHFDRFFGSRFQQRAFSADRRARMSDFLAAALGLAFALVVCLLALQAILSPRLRFRRGSASAISQHEKKRLAPAAQSRDTTPVHTA